MPRLSSVLPEEAWQTVHELLLYLALDFSLNFLFHRLSDHGTKIKGVLQVVE
ncbi:MAG: hypothetical protein N2A40_04590 [Desulfobulbaceae bacterium]